MRAGHFFLGLAAVACGVPAAFAQDSRVLNRGNSAGSGSKMGISLAVPTGRVWVDPQDVHGEPVYVRRVAVGQGMTVVEVSTTPFMPASSPGEALPGVRSDQPASW